MREVCGEWELALGNTATPYVGARVSRGVRVLCSSSSLLGCLCADFACDVTEEDEDFRKALELSLQASQQQPQQHAQQPQQKQQQQKPPQLQQLQQQQKEKEQPPDKHAGHHSHLEKAKDWDDRNCKYGLSVIDSVY